MFRCHDKIYKNINCYLHKSRSTSKGAEDSTDAANPNAESASVVGADITAATATVEGELKSKGAEDTITLRNYERPVKLAASLFIDWLGSGTVYASVFLNAKSLIAASSEDGTEFLK